MRDYKFRAWHKVDQIMIYQGWNYRHELGDQVFYELRKLFDMGESVEIQQYTEVNDKSEN